MLFLFGSLTVSLCLLDIILRLGHVPPPHWLGYSLSAILFGVSAWCFRSAWAQGRQRPAPPVRPQTPGWDASLPCLVHEIRNYSSVLKGNARLLRARMAGEAALEPLVRLERTSDKIEALAQEILEAADFPVRPESDSLCPLALIESCLADHFHDQRDRFRIVAEGATPAIAGDPRKLERVLLNLFRNAWEAGATSILIRLGQESGRLRMLVEDDGHGCPPESTAALFQPLYTTKRGKGGTGLGLYVAKSIVEAHGGAIWAVSKNAWPGNRTGMVFCLDFPVRGGEESPKLDQRPDWRKIPSEASRTN